MNKMPDGGITMPERVRTARKTAVGAREHVTGQVTFSPDEGDTMGFDSNTETKCMDNTPTMQRVEFDDWKVDATTLMADGGLFHHLVDEEKKALRLSKKKARRWVTAAICCETRSIVWMAISRRG